MTGHDQPGDRIAELEEEVAQLRQAIASRTVVDQAIGVIVTLSGLRTDEAWQVLVEVSQHTNTKLREIAAHVVDWPQGGWLPETIRHHLDVALVRHGAASRSAAAWPARRAADERANKARAMCPGSQRPGLSNAG